MNNKGNNFIKATNQVWKIILSLSVMSLLGTLLIYQQWFGGNIDIFEGKLGILALIGIAALVWGCISVKCSNCKAKILYHAISKVDHQNWVAWLFVFTTCPKCGYEPVASTENNESI